MKNLISMRNLKADKIKMLIKYAEALESGKLKSEMNGKIMGALFFEPSTRTQLSFETAMKKMGGEVITMAGTKGTSVEKGETLSDTVKIEDGQLLRRMIARRCIYGVDLNPITVQLARLSIWIHTFVPGLPLSLLDHNLVNGNALIGIGSLNEIKKKFDESAGTLFEVDADNLLGQAAKPLLKLAKLSDSSIKDIDTGRALMEEARLKTLETKALCDLIIAQAVSDNPILKGYQFDNWEKLKLDVMRSPALKLAREILVPQKVFHFPIAFPEIFLGKSQGFNVILGNPPWEKILVKENEFWGRYFPGLRGLSQKEYVKERDKLKILRPDLINKLEEEKKRIDISRNLIMSSSNVSMGSGHPDLYIPFSFRFLSITSSSIGKFGVVLPRSAVMANGSAEFRKQLFLNTSYLDLVILQNTNKWIFDMEPRYTLGLLSASKSKTIKNGISLRGPFDSLKSLNNGLNDEPVIFKTSDVFNWNDTVSIPLLPSAMSAEVFAQLRKSPRLDLNENHMWRARPLQEMNATFDADKMDFSEDCPKGFWKVYKGASFDLWNCDTGEYNGWADPNIVLPWLQKKRINAAQSARESVYKEFSMDYVKDQKTLSPYKPRIAFRDITNRTNSRTVISCLIPPKTFITNKGPVLMFPRGDEKDEAYLLGVLSSIPLDWYARCYVETNVNFFILNPFPIPRPERNNHLWRRVVELSGRLACQDESFSDWAAAVGVNYGLLSPDDKQDKIYELDALVSLLYGLSESQLVHIFETFHDGWNYEADLNNVLRHYHAWSDKV